MDLLDSRDGLSSDGAIGIGPSGAEYSRYDYPCIANVFGPEENPGKGYEGEHEKLLD
jgi:hypothetical protein